MSLKPTNVAEFLGELYGGVVDEKLSIMLSQLGERVTLTEKGGELHIKLKFKPLSATQVSIEHDIGFTIPKQDDKGTVKENSVKETIMYVNDGGNMSLFPENQTDMFRETEKAR